MPEIRGPEWFQEALATPFREGWTSVAGPDIHYLEWGRRGTPGLVFVHGGAAHAHWWSFLAPMFATDWHAVALDLSGHGESGRRDVYSHEAWADEVLAVTDAAGFPGPPVVVGHSLGGMVTIQTAATHGDRLAGAVIVDAPVRRPDPESEEGARGRAFRFPGAIRTSRPRWATSTSSRPNPVTTTSSSTTSAGTHCAKPQTDGRGGSTRVSFATRWCRSGTSWHRSGAASRSSVGNCR
jgi:pimeloyl-ACP methyl ester carboxylesterase